MMTKQEMIEMDSRLDDIIAKIRSVGSESESDLPGIACILHATAACSISDPVLKGLVRVVMDYAANTAMPALLSEFEEIKQELSGQGQGK
jgi:hypothetical protein